MTPATLLETLEAMPAEMPLVFETADGEIGDGYHVTEYKLAHVTGIDCGARTSSWSEATLQLLDGTGGGHMKTGKFAGILRQSIVSVTGLGDAPLQVEFAHRNDGKRIFDLQTPELEGGRVTVRLGDTRAHCKPAFEMMQRSEVVSCCGSGASGCCG